MRLEDFGGGGKIGVRLEWIIAEILVLKREPIS